MEKDLIIGAFTNYDFNSLKPWIKSINDCGFSGHKVLIAIDSTEEVHHEIADCGFEVIVAKNQNNMKIHMLRFLHIYDYLKKNSDQFNRVITTDVRDVIFQSDPSLYLDGVMNAPMIAQSEAIRIKDEAWNRNNIIKNFGQYYYDDVKDNEVLNVGILAGDAKYIKDLCFFLFQMSFNRPDWVADQAAYNVMLNYSPFKENTQILRLCDAWALNAHVTNKPEQMNEFGPYLLEERPYMEDGVVKNSSGSPFVIVHQYDRVPEWNQYYINKYGVEQKSSSTDSSDFFIYKT
jgi:hypothetical protein